MLRPSSPIAGLRQMGLSDQSWLRREQGGGVQVGYTSPSSGAERSMLSVPKKAVLESHEIENVRTAFTRHFGAAVTRDALRSIEERISQGKEIRGEHVRSA